MKGLSKLEAELGTPRARKKKKEAGGGSGPHKRETYQEEKRKKKKKHRKDEGAAHGRAQSAPPGGQWFGAFGAPAEADPADGSSTDTSPATSTSETDKKKKKKRRKGEGRDRARSAQDRGPFGDFRSGPPSANGTGLQLQLLEYAEKKPGRLGPRLLQRMQAMVGKEGGPTSLTPSQPTGC